MRRRKDNRNTQSRTYSARSYATNVKEDRTNKDNKQSKGYGKFNRRGRDGSHNKQPKRKPDDQEVRGNPKISRLPHRVCSETTHSNLLGCSKFKRFIPGKPDGSISLPKEVCQLCLGTVFSNCLHYGMKTYQDYLCKIAQVHFIFCHKCRKHQNAQDWMRENHDPWKGISNMGMMYKAIRAENVQINSIRIRPTSPS